MAWVNERSSNRLSLYVESSLALDFIPDMTHSVFGGTLNLALSILVSLVLTAKLQWKVHKKLSCRRDSAHLMSLRIWRSFRVTDFDTNWKRTWEFILVNITNLHCIFHHFLIIVYWWVAKLLFLTGVPLFTALVLSNLCKFCHRSLPI